MKDSRVIIGLVQCAVKHFQVIRGLLRLLRCAAKDLRIIIRGLLKCAAAMGSLISSVDPATCRELLHLDCRKMQRVWSSR